MKGVCLLVAVFLSAAVVLCSAAYALEPPLEIDISPDSVRTDLEMPAVFVLKVKNNQPYRDNLKINIEGPYIHWATNPVILLVVPRESTKDVSITFYPIEYRGSFDFDVIITSLRNRNFRETEKIKIEIPPPVAVQGFSFWMEGNEVKTNITVETLSNRSVSAEMSLYDTEGNKISDFSKTYNVLGRQYLMISFKLPENPLAGEYKITYKINGEIDGSGKIIVEPIHLVEKSKQLVSNPMYGNVIITLKNSGNVEEKNYAIRESLPPDSITGFITQTSSCEEGFLGSVCEYVVGDLQPGETAQIIYRVEYWPTYVQIMAALLIIAVIAGFSIIRAAKPSISKRSVRKALSSHTIVLEVKNPFLHHLKDVVIRDWVSPLGRVISEKTTGIVPVIKRSDAGSELIWNMGDMKPKETRIISYDIKTLLEGNLKMPRAYARFHTPKGKRFRIYSKILNI